MDQLLVPLKVGIIVFLLTPLLHGGFLRGRGWLFTLQHARTGLGSFSLFIVLILPVCLQCSPLAGNRRLRHVQKAAHAAEGGSHFLVRHGFS